MDLRTLFFVEASLLVLFGLTMIVNSIGQPWQKGSFYFAISNFCGALGLLLHSNKPGVSRIITMILANLFLYIELALMNKSIAEYVERGRQIWLYLLGFSLCMSLLSIQVILVHPNLPLRIDIISGVIIVCSVCSATLLLRYPAPGARTPTLVMGTLLIAYTATNAIRMVQVWWDPEQSFYHIWLDRTLVAGLSFGYLWMTAARLRLNLELQADTDALTNTLNRRAIGRETRLLFARHQTAAESTSALMLDVDYFKQINDNFGHYAGDLALCAIADCLRANTRPTDLIARLGGDEFLVILPNTDAQKAQVIADHLSICLHRLQIHTDTSDFHIHASIGTASLAGPAVTLEALMKQCDRALYAAKASSRLDQAAAIPTQSQAQSPTQSQAAQLSSL